GAIDIGDYERLAAGFLHQRDVFIETEFRLDPLLELVLLRRPVRDRADRFVPQEVVGIETAWITVQRTAEGLQPLDHFRPHAAIAPVAGLKAVPDQIEAEQLKR